MRRWDGLAENYHRACEIRGLAEATLRKKLDEVVKEKIYGDTTVRSITLKDFVFDQYLPYSKTNKKLSSYVRDTYSTKRLLETFEGKSLTEITVKDVENYKSRRCSEVSKATVNRELACLKGMLTKAIKWRYAHSNPVKEVKLFKEDNGRVRYLSPQEKDILLAYCPERIKPIVLTALLTGMRKGGIFNLRWPDVDLMKKIIAIRDTKNHETRYIEISKPLQKVLENVIRNISDQRVFGDAMVNFRKEWDGAVKRSGVEGIVFHSLRHTFASYLVMNGESLVVVQRFLGHKSLEMTLRYSHLAPEYRSKALEKLGETVCGKVAEKLEGVAEYMQNSKTSKLVAHG